MLMYNIFLYKFIMLKPDHKVIFILYLWFYVVRLTLYNLYLKYISGHQQLL